MTENCNVLVMYLQQVILETLKVTNFQKKVVAQG